jgi:hypothetical protein
MTTAAIVAASSTLLPQPALSAVDIKVTPLAHTFITASGAAAKPIRENDATRLFTNARVVYLFEGKNKKADANIASEVLDLTVQRKAGQGPGVTPGSVNVLSSTKSFVDAALGMGVSAATATSEAQDAVVAAARAMPEGDVLLVGPILSGGTAADGKVLSEAAKALGTFIGGKKEGGVISVLLDGPREGLQLEESGYPISELLWYSLPSK